MSLCQNHCQLCVWLSAICQPIRQIPYLIKNTPGVNKGWPRTNTGLAEKDVKSNGWPSGFDRLGNFGHDELTAKMLF